MIDLVPSPIGPSSGVGASSHLLGPFDFDETSQVDIVHVDRWKSLQTQNVFLDKVSNLRRWKMNEPGRTNANEI